MRGNVLDSSGKEDGKQSERFMERSAQFSFRRWKRPESGFCRLQFERIATSLLTIAS
jgi:hypothetical protein